MNLKNFDELLELLKEKAIIQNESYKKNLKEENKEILEDNGLNDETKKILLREITNSPQYNDILEYLENDFNNLSNSFKKSLIEFYNDYFTDLFNEYWMKDFYLLRDIISTHLELNFQRKVHNFPYQDKQKYDKRIVTLKKKKNFFIIPKLQSYERIKFFQHKASELININSLKLNTNNKREKDTQKREIILKIIDIICINNFEHIIEKKLNLRLTKKTSFIYNTELKEYEELLKNKSVKKYYLKP